MRALHNASITRCDGSVATEEPPVRLVHASDTIEEVRVCVIQARCVCVRMRGIEARGQEPGVKRGGSDASEEASLCATCPASSVCAAICVCT
jgi:hypothetical protein